MYVRAWLLDLPRYWSDTLGGDVVSRRPSSSGESATGKRTRGNCSLRRLGHVGSLGRRTWLTAKRWLVEGGPRLWVAADEGAARKEAARSSGSAAVCSSGTKHRNTSRSGRVTRGTREWRVVSGGQLVGTLWWWGCWDA